MSKAAPHVTPERQDFEDAINSLPHVRDGMSPEQWRSPRHWWFINATFGAPGDDRDTKATTYDLECILGRALAERLLWVCQRYPAHAELITAATLKDMTAVGRLSGIEVAFIERLVEAFAKSEAPRLSIVNNVS